MIYCAMVTLKCVWSVEFKEAKVKLSVRNALNCFH